MGVIGLVKVTLLAILCFLATTSGKGETCRNGDKGHFCRGETPDVLFIAIDDMNDWTTLFDRENPIQTPNLVQLV